MEPKLLVAMARCRSERTEPTLTCWIIQIFWSIRCRQVQRSLNCFTIKFPTARRWHLIGQLKRLRKRPLRHWASPSKVRMTLLSLQTTLPSFLKRAVSTTRLAGSTLPAMSFLTTAMLILATRSRSPRRSSDWTLPAALHRSYLREQWLPGLTVP